MANKMTSTRNRRLLRTWFTLTLLIFVLPSVSRCDTCQKPDLPKSVSENVPKGTKLLKIKYTQGETWTILKEVPDGYFDLTKGKTSFYLNAAKKLDYEELKERGQNMKVKLQCKYNNTSPVTYDVFITLNEVNEFVPNFTHRVYNKIIAENARIGDTVFLASDVASDRDYGDRLLFETANFPQEKDTLDGIASGKFNMTDYKTGLIVVNGYLDYEEQNKYIIKMIVKDTKGNQTSAELIITIADVDEFGPSFLPNPCATGDPQCQIPVLYHAQIKAADKGQISIFPNEVKAVDNEANNYTIGYSFSKGNLPNIVKYFKIDSRTAAITKVEDLPKNVTSSVTLFIKAEEQSTLKHFSVAILIIDILDRNSTVAMSTQTPDSVSVGALFTLLGVLLSVIFLFSLFGLALWIRRKRQVHHPLPDSKDYFTRPNLSTKVFPIRDKHRSEGYTGSSTIMTTILHGDSDEMASDRSSREQPIRRKLSANNTVKSRLKQVAVALENNQRQNPKSLRSIALPIRTEQIPKKDQLEEFVRRRSKSEEIFLKCKSPSGSNFGTFRSSYSSASRKIRRQMVTNGTLETYVSDYPTPISESPSYSMSRNSTKRRDNEESSSLTWANDGRRLSVDVPSLRDNHCKLGKEHPIPEQSHSPCMRIKCEKKDPNMPTEIAPPIPCTNKIKRLTPAKPPRKFANKERRQSAQSYDKQTQINKTLKHTAEKTSINPGSSLFVQERQMNLNKQVHAPRLSKRTRHSPINTTQRSKNPFHSVSHSRSNSNRTRLTDIQDRERACRSLENKLRSLEKTRRSNIKHSKTLERLPKRSERARRQTHSSPAISFSKDRPKDPNIDTSSSAETRSDAHDSCLRDSSQQRRRTPPTLPSRKTDITPVTNTMSTGEIHSFEEDDPQYINVKYTTLISDSAAHLSNRMTELSYTVNQNRSKGDEKTHEENVYLEPVAMQPCLEADLNIRAKLELILASALQKKRASEKQKNEKDFKNERMKEETIARMSSSAAENPSVSKFANHNYSSSSSSEKDDLSRKSCLTSQSLENIFLNSSSVAWPDPETTLATLHRHHLAMEDYTSFCSIKNKQESTSPCASVRSNSSNSSRCHFGRVNSNGQFIVDIPCAESNIHMAKATKPMAVPFRDVETSMGISMNSPRASRCQTEASSLRCCDDRTRDNGFPKTISFDGIDQYEIVHRHTIPRISSQKQITLEKLSPKADRAENGADKQKIDSKSEREREAKAKEKINSELNIFSDECNADANGRVSSKLDDGPSCFSPSRSIDSSGTIDSLSQCADLSIRSDCATVMSSELYEPSDSDGETVHSLKLFDFIFDNEYSVTFSSAESDSQSVFRACHPIPPTPLPQPPGELSPVSYPMCTNPDEKEEDDDGKEADDEADDVTPKTDNGRTGFYYVNAVLPNEAGFVDKEPVLNAYKIVNQDGKDFNETRPHTLNLPRTFVKMKKSKRIGRKSRHRLKYSDVY